MTIYNQVKFSKIILVSIILTVLINSAVCQTDRPDLELNSIQHLIQKELKEKLYPNLTKSEKKIFDEIDFIIDTTGYSDFKSATSTVGVSNQRVVYINKNLFYDLYELLISQAINSYYPNFSEYYTKEFIYISKDKTRPDIVAGLDSSQLISVLQFFQFCENCQHEYQQLILFILYHEIAHHIFKHNKLNIEHRKKLKKHLDLNNNNEVDKLCEIYKKMEYDADDWAISKLKQNDYFDIQSIERINFFIESREVFRQVNFLCYPSIFERMEHIYAKEINESCREIEPNDDFDNLRCVELKNSYTNWISQKSLYSNEFEEQYKRFRSINEEYYKIIKLVDKDTNLQSTVDILLFLGTIYLRDINTSNNIDTALYYFQKGSLLTSPKIAISIIEATEGKEEIMSELGKLIDVQDKEKLTKEYQEHCSLLTASIYEYKFQDFERAIKFYERASESGIYFPKSFYENKIKTIKLRLGN